jgi:5-methylcytosine-specific restriction endonuclease McrA
MSRKEFSAKTKLAAWERAGHHCEECTNLIRPGHGPEYDHIIEDYYDGGNHVDNCRVLCIGCHKAKTRKQAAVIAKSRRLLKKQAGLTRKKKAINNRGFTSWRNFAGEIVTKKG